MSKLLIEQIYPFMENVGLSRDSLRQLSVLIEKRDSLLEEFQDNNTLMEWIDSSQIESVIDLLESEEALLVVFQREFPKKHPLIKNTHKIITFLKEK